MFGLCDNEFVDETCIPEKPIIETPRLSERSVGDFVLVRFDTKKTCCYYIGKVEKIGP